MDIGYGYCSSSNNDNVTPARCNGEKRLLAGRGINLGGRRGGAVGGGPDDVGDRGGGGQLVNALVGGDVMQFQDVAVCTGDEGVGWADDGKATRYGRRRGVLHGEDGGGWKKRCRVYLQESVTMAKAINQ